MSASGGTGIDNDDTELTVEVLQHLEGVVRALQAYAVSMAGEFDLTVSQLDALKSLGGKPCSQRELARSLHFDASNVTDIVDRLEARGLVTRTVDPTDRRVRRLVLTPEGEAVRRKLFEQVLDNSPVTNLSASDQRLLLKLLAKIAAPVNMQL